MSSSKKTVATPSKLQDVTETRFMCCDSNTREKLNQKLQLRIKDYLRENLVERVVWSANAAGCFDLAGSPSGFVFVVKNGWETPVYPDIFHKTKMTHGISVMPLDGIKGEGGKELNDQYIQSRRPSIAAFLDTHIPEKQAQNPFTLETHFDVDSVKESSPWSHALGGSGSYVGLFKSQDPNSYTCEPRYWLVCHGGSMDASQELVQLAHEAVEHHDSGTSTAGSTWRHFFDKDQTNLHLLGMGRRARARMLADMAQALKLSLRYDTDMYSAEPRKSSLRSLIETDSYSVTKRGRNAMAFHSATIDPATIANGLVLSDNPYKGPVILYGPQAGADDRQEQMEFGGPWVSVSGSYGAFPATTGRVMSLVEARKKAAPLTEGPFHWENMAVKSAHPRLVPNLYRQRDPEFRSKEIELGYKPFWGELYLRPVFVKLVGPDE